jgi:adenylate cyclase
VGALFLMRTVFYVVMPIVVISSVTAILLGALRGYDFFQVYGSALFWEFVTSSRFPLINISLAVASFAINLLRQVNRMLGPGILLHLLLGTYHRPLAEERIFMFLDLNASTAIAEQLGPLRFNDFKNDFFFRHDGAHSRNPRPHLSIRRRRGHRHVDHEAGLTAGQLSFLFLPYCGGDTCAKERYLAKYGTVPEFKAGFHGGPVTAKIGDVKKDIVYSGDTVNTTARIEAQCRPLNRQVLVSGTLLEQCQIPKGLKVEEAGDHLLPGKEEAIKLHSVKTALTEPQRDLIETVV